MIRPNPYAQPGLKLTRAQLTERLMIAVKVLNRDMERAGHLEVIVRTVIRDGVRSYAK